MSSIRASIFISVFVFQFVASQNCLDKRLLQSYAVKGCAAVMNPKTKCPVRYECPVVSNSLSQRSEGCDYRNKIYAFGERIPTANPCAICSCGYNNEINCVYSECPGDAFGIPPFPQNASQTDITVGKYKNCYYFHTLNECCGTPKCPSDAELNQSPKCNYNGKAYNVGDKIYPTEDTCKICVCSEGWNPKTFLSSSSCRTIECDLNMKLINKGCVPVYHEAHCCPIEYKCPPPTFEERQEICALSPEVGPCDSPVTRFYYNSTTKKCETFTYSGCVGNDNNFGSAVECQNFCSEVKPKIEKDKNKCLFGEKLLSIGDKLAFDSCLECSCAVPPDLVCVNKC